MNMSMAIIFIESGKPAMATSSVSEPSGSHACFTVMKSTEKKARRGMSRFVVTIFAIAVVIAAFYILVLTPGSA